MLTPIEIHNAQHKTGRGYSKKEMDEFLADVVSSYESIYKENVELKNSISKLQGEMDYYKSMENTLQKALILAEQTSKDTIDTANQKAEIIEKEAIMKADKIINSANSQYDGIRQKCLMLIQQYNQFKMQFKQIAVKQIELLDSDFYEIYTNDLTKSLNEAIDTSSSGQSTGGTTDDKTESVTEDTEDVDCTDNAHDEDEADNVDEAAQDNVLTSDTKDIPSINLDSLDSLLNDIRTDFAKKNKASDSEGSKFEFLDNE